MERHVKFQVECYMQAAFYVTNSSAKSRELDLSNCDDIWILFWIECFNCYKKVDGINSFMMVLQAK